MKHFNFRKNRVKYVNLGVRNVMLQIQTTKTNHVGPADNADWCRNSGQIHFGLLQQSTVRLSGKLEKGKTRTLPVRRGATKAWAIRLRVTLLDPAVFGQLIKISSASLAKHNKTEIYSKEQKMRENEP